MGIQEKFKAWQAKRAANAAKKEEQNLIKTIEYDLGKLDFLNTRLNSAYDYAIKEKSGVEKWLEGDRGQHAPATPQQMLDKIDRDTKSINKMIDGLEAKGTDIAKQKVGEYKETLRDIANIKNKIVEKRNPELQQAVESQEKVTHSRRRP